MKGVVFVQFYKVEYDYMLKNNLQKNLKLVLNAWFVWSGVVL